MHALMSFQEMIYAIKRDKVEVIEQQIASVLMMFTNNSGELFKLSNTVEPLLTDTSLIRTPLYYGDSLGP